MANDRLNTYFFELLQVAIGNRDVLSGVPTPEEWEEIYEIAKKQTLVGIAFKGVERLPLEQMPPQRRVRQWAVKGERLVEKNKRMMVECKALTDFFGKHGFDSCVLKGQANIPYYRVSKNTSDAVNVHQPLGMYRVPGDIDMWVRPRTLQETNNEKGKAENEITHPVRSVIEFCQKVKKGEFVYYHNLDFPILKSTSVEIHYRPTWLFCPWRDRRLQKWFKEHYETEEYAGFMLPTVEFNVIFQMLHIYKHIFEEGIGLRQLLDYYFVLVAYHRLREENMDMPISETNTLVKHLGLRRFAGAMMYVLKEVFAMPEVYMLCPVNDKEGRIILQEMMEGGNFGHSDERYTTTREDNVVKWGVMKLVRNMKFLTSYPEEVICEPFFRIFHWAWRTFKLWKY